MSRFRRMNGYSHRPVSQRRPANETEAQRKLRWAIDTLEILKSEAINASKYTRAAADEAWKDQEKVVEKLKKEMEE